MERTNKKRNYSYKPVEIASEKNKNIPDIKIKDLNISQDKIWQKPIKEYLSLDEEENLDKIIDSIKFIHPRNPFTHFCNSKRKEFTKQIKESKENNTKNNSFENLNKNLAKAWKGLTKIEKEPYIKLYEKEKNEYTKDLLLIRKYLFLDINDRVNRPITSYQMFLEDRLIEGINKLEDPAKIRKKAKVDWSNMNKNDKEIFSSRREKAINWHQKAKNLKKITGISLYIQKKFAEAKEKKEPYPNITSLSQKWKNLDSNLKIIFEKEANILALENERLLDIYYLCRGIKNKKPIGAFRLFMLDLAKNLKITDKNLAKEKWNLISQDEKELYIKKNHRLSLAYKYKDLIYKKKIKKIKKPKKPGSLWTEYLKSQKGKKIPEGENALKYWSEKFKKISQDQKDFLQKKIEKQIDDYKKYEEEMKNKIFKYPQKPVYAFGIFIKENINQIIAKINSREYNAIRDESVKIWSLMAEEEKIIYKNKAKNNIELP